MKGHPAWASDANAALLTDLYELMMLQAYFDEGMMAKAVFDPFAPPQALARFSRVGPFSSSAP